MNGVHRVWPEEVDPGKKDEKHGGGFFFPLFFHMFPAGLVPD